MSEVRAIFEKLKIEYSEYKNGQELKFRCVHPEHNDRNPSAYINTTTGQWFCFSCGRKGSLSNIIKLVKGEDVDVESFLSTSELLQMKIHGLYKKSSENILKYEDILNFKETIDYEFTFFKPLETNAYALSYVVNRGVSIDVVRRFNIMFAESGNYKNRIIIPYYKNKEIVGFNSRTIDPLDSIRYLYYLNSSAFKGYIYNLDNIINTNYCIIVEGPFDLLKLHSLKFKNVISTLNTNVSFDHISEILRFNKIIFMFDNDIDTNAGYNAMIKAANNILSVNPNKHIYYAELPAGKDPSSCSLIEIKYSLNHLYKVNIKDNEPQNRGSCLAK